MEVGAGMTGSADLCGESDTAVGPHECDRNPCRICGAVRCPSCGAPVTHRNDSGCESCEEHCHNEDGTPGWPIEGLSYYRKALDARQQ